MILSALKLIRTAGNWLVGQFILRSRKKYEARQLVHYHPFMFGKL